MDSSAGEDIARKVREAAAQRRTEYIMGLRMLADVLEGHPEVRLPVYGRSGARIHFYFDGTPDGITAMAAARRAFPCTWEKHFTGGENTDWFDLRGELAGLEIELYTPRDAVCERVVTGTREVTEIVKDPEVLAKVPEIEVTKVIEEVEWRCHPVLATGPAPVTGDAPETSVAA